MKKKKIKRNQKWFYYTVKWTTPITMGKIYIRIYNIYRVFLSFLRRIDLNWRKRESKMKPSSHKDEQKWFWGIRYHHELFAVVLLTIGMVHMSTNVCLSLCVGVFCAQPFTLLAFELNCDSFQNHFIIYGTLIFIFFSLSFSHSLSMSRPCFQCVYVWHLYVIPCSIHMARTKLTMSLFPFDMCHCVWCIFIYLCTSLLPSHSSPTSILCIDIISTLTLRNTWNTYIDTAPPPKHHIIHI